jgi:nicotinate-nucleotide adenylyltransferase
MGGTFDPVHHGHLSAANEVRHRYDLDEVVFVPTVRSALQRTATS